MRYRFDSLAQGPGRGKCLIAAHAASELIHLPIQNRPKEVTTEIRDERIGDNDQISLSKFYALGAETPA